MEDRGRRGDLRRQELGQRLLRHQQARATSPSSPTSAPTSPSTSRNWSINCRPAASSCRSCSASPTSCAIASARSTTPSATPSSEFDYQGNYCCVYPIKVNQQRHVVEEILDFGKPFHFGLEAGSKPELLAVLALTNGLDTPIICNGFKDDEFIKMAMLARKIGKQIIPVVEKFTELEAIVRHAEELEVRPVIGVRVKLAARGAGRWQSSAGYRSKFGLTLTEVLEAVEYLEAARHGRLLATGPLPPRQPDHQHPQHQERPDRGGPRLRRAAPRRRRRSLPRRRRRPRHRLRRLADRFRVVGQLHAAGIRQRRRLPHQERLRRGRRAASDDHLRVGPGGGRLSQPAGLRRAGRVQLRPLRGAAGGARRRPAADQRPVRHLPRPEEEEHPGELSRRRAGGGRSAEHVQPRLRSTSRCGPWRSGCSGRCAASC